MKKTTTYSLLLAALLSTACADGHDTAGAPADGMTPLLLAAGGAAATAATRAQADGEGMQVSGAFMSGQAGAVKAFVNVAGTATAVPGSGANGLVTYTTNGSVTTVMTPDSQPYFPVGHNADIRACYPAAQLAALTAPSATQTFTVQADQSAPADYRLSDLMYAGSLDKASTSSVIPLAFSHKLTRVNISISTAVSTVTNVTILGINRTSGAFSMADGTIAPTTPADQTVVAYTSDSGLSSLTATAIIPPQPHPTGNLVQVTLAQGDILLFNLLAEQVFQSGKEYSYAFTISKSGGKPIVRSILQFVSLTVDDWIDGGEKEIQL